MTETEDGDPTPGAPPPPRAYIVTIFGLYVREFGGWLGVGSLIRMMAVLGVEEPAVRSSISRLKRRAILLPERRGAVAGYALSDYARHVLEVGDRRIFERFTDTDDDWVLAIFSVPESQRQKRHVLRSRLSWLGFGTVSSGVWIAPGHVIEDTRRLLLDDGLDQYVTLFRADYYAFGDPREEVTRWWDLGGLERRYREFVATYGPRLERWRGEQPDPRDAFVDYVQVLTAWRRLPYLDPGLPTSLLPDGWTGTAAADLFFELKRVLEKPAHDYVDELTRG